MRQWLALDKRSLALMRIALGLVLTLDILLRLIPFRAHYTNEGIFPLKDYLFQPDLTYRRWSVFYMNDNPWFVLCLFGLFLLATLALTAGYRTRAAGWVCLVLLWGIYRRNPVLNNSGDYYMPLLLLWGNFLPWGEAFSLDSRRRLDSDGAYYSAFPGFCYLIQVANLYWFTAVLRTGPEWQVSYSALYYALHLYSISTSFAPYCLLMGTTLMAFFTWATIMLEIFGPVLLLIPSQYSRLAGVILIMCFHLGIMSTLLIPVFALVCTIGPLGLLPPMFWESRLGRGLAERLSGLFERWQARLGLSEAEQTKEPGLWGKRARAAYPWITVPLMGLTTFVLWWGIHWPDDRSALTSTLRAFSLDQRWGMFSPAPLQAIGWEAARARTESGKEVNLITGKPFTDKVEDYANACALWDYRWRSFRLSIDAEKYSHTALYLRYLAKEWDKEHPADKVVAAQYVYCPESFPAHFLLGEQYREVMSEYHK